MEEKILDGIECQRCQMLSCTRRPSTRDIGQTDGRQFGA